MRKYASFVQTLNSEGIYLRNQSDVIRLHYGLMKSAQQLTKIAEGVDDITLSDKERAKLKEQAEKAKKKIEAKAKKEQELLQVELKKKLAYHGANGIKINFHGQLHKGNIQITLTKNFFNMRGKELNLKDFEKVVSQAQKERKPFAKDMAKAQEELAKYMEMSKAVASGKINVPKKGIAYQVLMAIAKIAGVTIGFAALAIFGSSAIISILIGLSGLGVSYLIAGLGYLGLAFLVGWLMKTIKKFGFKGAMRAIGNIMSDAGGALRSRTAGYLPSTAHQVTMLKLASANYLQGL